MLERESAAPQRGVDVAAGQVRRRRNVSTRTLPCFIESFRDCGQMALQRGNT